MSLDIDLIQTCPTCGHAEGYWANITHNLNEMADEAGLYGCVWRPEENGITHAHQLIEPLTKGIADMKARPEHYTKFNAKNGWGMYKHFVPWLEELLTECKRIPNATISVSR